MTGQRFGRLTVVEYAGDSHWRCRCECGRTTVSERYKLIRGDAKSCGCYSHEMAGNRNRTHGRSETTEYYTWLSMKQRCTNPRNHAYKDYGGRGIYICQEWLTSFETFLRDIGPRPSPDYTLDRYNNDGPYSPENCHWATPIEQATNKRNTVRIGGQPLTVYARANGLSITAVRHRLERGWDAERVRRTPRYANPGRGGFRVDLTGQIFGRLFVISHDTTRRLHWLCRCTCGTEVSVGASNLKRGGTRSCGCLLSEYSKTQKNGAKLKPEQVADIRQRHAAGTPQKELAADYDIHQTQISRIVNGKRWAI